MYPYEQFAKLQNGLLYIKTKSVSFYLSLFIYSKIYIFADLGSVYVGHSGQDCAGLRHLREEEPGQGILQVVNLRQTFFFAVVRILYFFYIRPGKYLKSKCLTESIKNTNFLNKHNNTM